MLKNCSADGGLAALSVVVAGVTESMEASASWGGGRRIETAGLGAAAVGGGDRRGGKRSQEQGGRAVMWGDSHGANRAQPTLRVARRV